MSDDELLDFLPQQHADFDLDSFSAAPTAAPAPLPAFAPAVSCLDAFHLHPPARCRMVDRVNGALWRGSTNNPVASA
jgi:hypothetical protein